MRTSKHPKPLWILSFVYSLYAIGFGTLFACLLLFFSQQLHMSEKKSFQLFAAFNALVFTLPLIGGYLCDRFGFKNNAIIGLMITFLGMLCIGGIHDINFMYIGLSGILAGNALCMPAIWSLVGMQYHKEDARRESGSTIFYLLFNIGFLISFSTSGYVTEQFSYHSMFIIYAMPIFIALLVFIIFQKVIIILPEYADEKKISHSPKIAFLKLLIITIILIPIFFFLLKHDLIDNILIWVLIVFIFVYLIHFGFKMQNKAQMKKLFAFLLLCIFGLAYFVIYNSEFGLLPEYALNNVNRTILSFTIPASSITSLDPFYCLVIGTIFSILWVKLDKKNANPALPTKFSLGILSSAIGYLILSCLVYTYIDTTLPFLWLFLVFAFFVSGELLVFPIGIAMVGKLSPPGKEGLLMGMWNLINGAASLLTGYVAQFTIVPNNLPLSSSNQQYFKVFLSVGIIVFLIGIFAFSSKNKIKNLIR